MNKLILACLMVLLILGTSACKKDYPDDIPKWLKKKVRQLERQTSFHRGNKNGGAMIIDEWTDGSEVIYIFHTGIHFWISLIVYDQDGNEQCNTSGNFVGSCGELNDLSKFNLTRQIWKEKQGW
jgi:uncharacterized protein YtpQ (UPF0354 family)